MSDKLNLIIKQDVYVADYEIREHAWGDCQRFRSMYTVFNNKQFIRSDIIYKNKIDKLAYKRLYAGGDIYIPEIDAVFKIKNIVDNVFGDSILISIEDKFEGGHTIRNVMSEAFENKWDEISDEFAKIRKAIEKHNEKSFLERLFSGKIKL